MMKFLSKYILEVIPSILATVVGAYIVTHYINAKPDADKPKTEVAAPATPAAAAPVRAAGQDSRKESAKAALIPDDKPQAAEKPADKPLIEKTSLEKPTEIAVEPRRQPIMKDFLKRKTVVKASPEPAEPIVASPDDRDANDLARAAIERLRNADQAKAKDAPRETAKPIEAPRIQEAVRTPEPVRMPEPAYPQQERTRMNAVYAPPVAPITSVPAQMAPAQMATAPALPPATVVTPAQSFAPPMSSVSRVNDPSRPTPPADIPMHPRDLRASAVAQDKTSVADDVVAAAKTVFKSVIPDNR